MRRRSCRWRCPTRAGSPSNSAAGWLIGFRNLCCSTGSSWRRPRPSLGRCGCSRRRAEWQQTREQLFSMWLQGLDIPKLAHYIREDMGSCPFEMWARAGREIAGAYAKFVSPLQALATLDPPAPVLHVYAQPEDPGYLAARRLRPHTPGSRCRSWKRTATSPCTKYPARWPWL